MVAEFARIRVFDCYPNPNSGEFGYDCLLY